MNGEWKISYKWRIDNGKCYVYKVVTWKGHVFPSASQATNPTILLLYTN